MDQIPPEQLATLKAEDMGPVCNAVVITFTAIAIISVTLRFYTRIALVRTIGIEDYFILASMCCSIMMAACQIMQVRWGNGKHALFISLDAANSILKYLYFSVITYCASISLTKISILLQYRKIFSTGQMKLPIYIVMTICAAYGIECVLAGTFTCIPISAFWDIMRKPTARCVNENALYWTNASLNILTDWLVAILPMKAIWDLHLPRRQKIAILFILCLGWFVCIVSILRLDALITLSKHPEDTTWYSSATAYWSAIEVNLAIVCASAPALKALVVKVIPRFASQFKSGSNGQRSSRDWSNKGSGHSGTMKDFIELKGQNSRSSMATDLERDGDTFTALPVVGGPPRGINYRVDVEQYSERTGRGSESDSQRDLTSTYPNPYTHR